MIIYYTAAGEKVINNQTGNKHSFKRDFEFQKADAQPCKECAGFQYPASRKK